MQSRSEALHLAAILAMLAAFGVVGGLLMSLF
jgi:hypothetical protein